MTSSRPHGDRRRLPSGTRTPLVPTLASSLALLLGLSGASAAADEVAVTPLGSHDGEFCTRDRALVFEDPNGTRVLYDAGRTVAGREDPRLGDIDVVLISHLHGDHVGDQRIAAVNEGECGAPVFGEALTHTNSVDIAVGKGATILTGSEMPPFLAGKLEAAGGDPAKSVLVRFGGSREIGGVTFTTVPATHSNGVSGALIGGEIGSLLDAANVAAYVGPPTGYVVTFSNGLVAYLSGDTGITAEQKSTVADYYGARLAVMNIGDTNTTGPREAVYVIDELVKPASVIASHANEAATEDGEVIKGTRTATFIEASETPVHLPLSGRTMRFDAEGECVAGC